DAGLIPAGFAARLDEAGIPYEQGGHTLGRVLAANEVVKSPGIPETASVVRDARAKGVPVIGEIELAARHADAPIIGITGSNGKSTPLLLGHDVPPRAGMDAVLAGNVGTPFASILARLQHALSASEPSSSQLDGPSSLRPNNAVITNIT